MSVKELTQCDQSYNEPSGRDQNERAHSVVVGRREAEQEDLEKKFNEKEPFHLLGSKSHSLLLTAVVDPIKSNQKENLIGINIFAIIHAKAGLFLLHNFRLF